jgi:ABC-2 type transport system permease protein
MLFWPVIGILSIGLMGGFLGLKGNMREFLLTGAIVAGVFQTSQLDVAYGFLYDVWSKSVKQTFIAPVRNMDYIAALFFKFRMPPGFALWASLAGVYLTAMITGMMTIFFIFMFGQRIDIIAWMMSALTMLLCGIYYPVTYLPPFFERLAQFIPLTYFLEYFRTGYGFSLNFTHPLLKGFGLSAAYIGILLWMIEMAFLKAKKSGMLVKLSE